MKNLILLIITTCLPAFTFGQITSPDTVVVQLANSSKLVFTIGDPSDLSLLEHYDFQALFEDIIDRLEDEAIAKGELKDDDMNEEDDEEMEEVVDHEDWDEEEKEEDDWDEEERDDYEEDYDAAYDDDHDHDRHRKQNILGSANLDFGINSYLNNNGFPDNNDEQYTVRPWGSWYVGLNSVYHTRVNEHFRFQWGIGFSSYNFKFQDDRTELTEGPNSVIFSTDDRDVDFIKSKLTVNYINASIVPVVEFGRYRDKPRRWHSHHRDFRVGLGVYGGYRIGSYTKLVHEIDDEREKERTRDNFYLNNLRYGLRLQLGLFDTDFFVNYDLNDLFADGRGPQLNAYSFGIIF